MTLIQEARQALDLGDQARAHQLALLATSDPAQEEQAWLILASLSEPQQALLYIENALKVNPDSQAARKAIRLVYGQMSANEEDQAQLDDIPPIKPLDDTAPIPVTDVNQAGIAPKAEEKSDAQETEIAEAQVTATAAISKSALRNKLRQRTSVQEIEKPASPAEETIAAEPSPKKEGRFFKKRVLKEAGEAEIREDTQTQPEVELEKGSEGLTTAPVSEEKLEAASTVPVIEALPTAAVETQAPDTLEEELPQKAVEEVLSGKTNRKVAVNKPAEDIHAERATVKKEPSRNNNQEPANVDTIELILVSIAAILLPLLVFLYFYLTK